MGLNGDFLTMAQAVGEAPMPDLVFYPGENFDPYDEDDVAAVGLAMEREKFDKYQAALRENERLERENARLREQLGLSDEDDDHADWND